MDELRGPNIQIILHVKEGIGFGFLKTPFMVSGTLNGYVLETDPAVPCHAPIFDAELVWEADKRRFRSLRVQNVPVKVEVYTLGTQGHKDKVGYLLLSLLGAQPCPAKKIVDVKHTWHKLLGVKSAGKCCHPQLMISLTVEDRVNMLTPRNELRMFHTNEVACPASYTASNIPTNKNILMTINEYIAESKKTVSSPDLQPKLICEEGLIQIGNNKQLFLLSLVIGSVDNLDLLLPDPFDKEDMKCHVSYSVFTHDIMTDRVSAQWADAACHARCSQRSSLRVRSSLRSLAGYFAQCPSLVVTILANDIKIGICSMDLRKLIPTDDVNQFLMEFCNSENALVIHERCFILRFEGGCNTDTRRPFMDIEMCLKYVGEDTVKPNMCVLSARSAVQLESARRAAARGGAAGATPRRAASCADLGDAAPAYTAPAPTNTARYKDASGECVLQTNEITELIKKMCESFTQSQEKLLAKSKTTSDVQVQCDHTRDQAETRDTEIEREPLKPETSKSDTCIRQNDKGYIDMMKASIPAIERDSIMQKFVDELEDWKERQQELFKIQLKRKEDYHLELLSKEWAKKRIELESKLSKGIEQCRTLAGDLSRATDDFRLRGYRNTEREKKLLEAKKSLEAHYTAKYQELREASQKMEDDMNHLLKMKDMRIEELETNVAQLNKQVEVLKNNLRNNEKDAESKYSGLTKDQTASLIQELRCLEEKLEGAVQSKAFFKEQWGRAVRELHAAKLRTRTLALLRLRAQRRRLHNHGLDIAEDPDESDTAQHDVDINKLKDDFYVDILANTPALDSHSIMSTSIPDMTGMDEMEDLQKAPKNMMNQKLSELITQRDDLIQQENPDEELIKQLNHDIRNMLLNCGT